ncbi:MAG: hypothetical protein ABI402_11655 [Ferruginibacter sp.]
MQKLTGKNISLGFAILATILLLFHVSNLLLEQKFKTRIWDHLHAPWYRISIFTYPVLLFISYILYFLNKYSNGKYDAATRLLIFSNGLILLMLVVFLIAKK